MGTTVIGGMVAETFIGRFFVPGIFVLVEKWSASARQRLVTAAPNQSLPAEGESNA
jgi:uncharacterized membrane protein YdfJ with MMPL/SSD domain